MGTKTKATIETVKKTGKFIGDYGPIIIETTKKVIEMYNEIKGKNKSKK